MGWSMADTIAAKQKKYAVQAEYAERAEKKLLDVTKKYGVYILLWLMCAVSISAVLYIYTEEPFNIYTLAGMAASAGLIRLLDVIRRNKLGTLIYIVLVITVSIISGSFINDNGELVYRFVRWFFSGAQAEETQARFLLALTPMMTFFLTSAFYYFTRVIYRCAMLTLVSLIPFALAVKAATVLPYAYPIIMSALDLIFLLIDGRRTLVGKSEAAGSRAAVYTDFAAAAFLLALILPKPSETPYYEKFEEAVSMFSFGGSGETVFKGEYMTESGTAEELIRGESKLIYIISTDDPVYMKAQVFDLYDTASGRWLSIGDGVSGEKDWQETAGLLSFEKLGDALKTARASWGEQFEQYTFAKDMPDIEERESYSIVYTRNFASQYVLSPLRATEVNLSNVEGTEWCARSTAGEIFTNHNKRLLPPEANYTVRYYSEDAFDKMIESGFCDITFEEYGDFITDLWIWNGSDSEEYAAAIEFSRELENAEWYRIETETEVSPEIQTLADELTEGLEYDYQKAAAIEQFFNSGEFLYDLNYEAPEGMRTPEHFLFESKRGICSDFATAYTLLARAAGLTVRYVEGFVPQPSDDDGVYFINTDNAHAYPEVFIPGAGWKIYEPTVAGFVGRGSQASEENGAEVDHTAVFLTSFAVVCGFGMLILIVLISPKIAEGIFRIKVKRIGGGKGVIMLYNRHIRNAEGRFGMSLKAFTPEQTEAVTSERTGASAKPLTEPFTAACYGGADISRDDFEKAYECYKTLRKNMRSKKQKKGRRSV